MKPDFKCPYCNYEFEIDKDDLYKLVTFWGSDDIKDIKCIECESIIYIKELVSRSYRAGKTIKEARGY